MAVGTLGETNACSWRREDRSRMAEEGKPWGLDGASEPGSRALGVLAYFLVALSGVCLLVLRREDRFVRFHSLQAVGGTIVFFAIGFVLWALAGFPIFGFLYAYLLRVYLVALFFYWLFLMHRAWRGDFYRIPYLGRFIEREFD